MEVIVQRNPIPESPGYTVSAYIGEYRPDVIVIIQVDYKYYFTIYDVVYERYYIQLLNSRDVFNNTVSIPIKTILYNFEKQNFEDVRIGHIVLESISTSTNFEILGLNLSSETDSRVWTSNLIVKEISGPYQNNKLVDVIDLAQPVYYLATPSDINAHDSQVLSIKWEYQYNNEESIAFKNSKRSVVVENGVKKCKLECRFHNKEDILDITLFAFYKSKSSNVLLKNSTGNKKNVDKSNLIWSSKLTIEEQNKIIEISNRLSSDPNHLIAAMALETGGTFNPALVNSLGYTGLIQIGDEASKDINRRKGTKITAGKNGNLVKMSRLEQLKYVEYYLEPFKGKLNTLGDFYLAILFPVDCGKGNLPNHIVFDENIRLDYDSKGNVIKNIKWLRQRAYAQNPAFHKEKPEQGKTYVWEITQEIEKWYKKGEGETEKGNTTITPHENKETEISKQDENWHDPVINPISTIYMQSGGGGENGKHWGLFGKTRLGKSHTGLDLFAVTGTNIYACVDGTVYNRRWHGGYGNTITIKIKDVEAFLKNKRDYKLQYEKQGEMLQGIDWNVSKNIYLFYAHLDTINEYKFGDEIKCGDILGTTGRSGITAGTCAPHLHFEIFCDYTMGVGTRFRINPAVFVDYKGFKEQSESEKNVQEDVKNIGKITEVNGKTKLNYSDMKGFIK